MVYARAYTCADIYHTRKAPIVAVSLTVIEVAKFCVAKNKRDKRFLYVICTRRFAHIGLRNDMQLQNYEKIIVLPPKNRDLLGLIVERFDTKSD